MAIRSGELRERVRVERRGAVDDGYGNTVSGDWAPLFDVALPARIRPGRQTDSVMAARLQGVNVYDVQLRQDARSRQIGADDRLVWLRDGVETVMNIRGEPVDPDGKRRELRLTVEAGVAS